MINSPEYKKMIQDIKEQTEKIPLVLFEPTFGLISEIIDSQEVLINVPKYNIKEHEALLLKNDDRGFSIEIENIFADFKERYDIEIIIGENVYLVEGLSLGTKSTTLRKKEGSEYLSGKFVFTANIHEIRPISDRTEDSFCRFVISLGKSQIDNYLVTKGYRDEKLIHTLGAFFFDVNGKSFSMHERKFRDKYYLLIDSLEKINSEEFSDICHSVMISYGFLSADFHQDESFLLKSDSVEFNSVYDLQYLQLRPSIISHGTCNPIYGNPYGYTRDENIVNSVGNKLTLIDSGLFSKLVSKVHTDKEYAILILLILEANTSSLILRPAGYSVALEKLTNIIVEENKGLKPIPDKTLARKLRKEFSAILTSLKSEIEQIGNEDSITILQKNIDKINNPTNRDKLTKPFDIYEIELKEEDISAIDNRNNFLHGRNIKIEEGSDEFIEIWSISMRLNKLINMLILKHIGFSGYIINHLKHNEESLGFTINENLFEKI